MSENSDFWWMTRASLGHYCPQISSYSDDNKGMFSKQVSNIYPQALTWWFFSLSCSKLEAQQLLAYPP